MMRFYSCQGICLVPISPAALPPGAQQVDAPFAPLALLLYDSSPGARGIWGVRSYAELYESPGIGLLCPPQASPADFDFPKTLQSILASNGAAAVNTAYANWHAVLRRLTSPPAHPRITLIGLGDVGGALLMGLKLLGHELAGIGIYDPNASQCARYEMELNQVLPYDGAPLPPVTIQNESTLFDCDAILFAASRGVPPLSHQGDVRMAQYAANRHMLEPYAKRARDARFTGLFAQISDPVDHLARAVFEMSNEGASDAFDFAGLLPEQVQGYGLGVMRARAAYYAQSEQVDFSQGRAYGPHGEGLVIANAPNAGYDAALSLRLTELAQTANLRVRELGFKPYIAPGLSSACVSVLRTLRGEWHDGAVPLGGAYFGCTSRFTQNGLEVKREALCPALRARIEAAHTMLKEF
jgi:hypothetical protein